MNAYTVDLVFPPALDVLDARRDVILAALSDEPLSREEAEALIDELGEIETALQKG